MTQERVIAGRYSVIREIGRGGMGIVWLADDRTIGRRVAIKELHLAERADPRARRVLKERVLREARAAGRLNDPAVVTVYDVLREHDRTFIVMELIEAPTLADIVDREGPMPPGTVARIAEQLLSALQTAHAAGVVHRDVKPSNIMVLPNGRVKLTDFGIAQSTDDPHLTTTGILVGSPVYMAPERLRGADADAGSDLWALGAVLFFAVEGYSAFERDNTAAAIQAILNEVPQVGRCQGPLATVITGLLNSHPEARPSAPQVRRLLTQATTMPRTRVPTAPVPVVLSGNTQHTPAPVTPRRRWSLPVLAVAVALATAMFAGGYVVHAVTAPDPTAPRAERPAAMAPALTYGSGGDLRQFTWAHRDGGGICLTGELREGARITDDARVDCAKSHDTEIFDWLVFWSKPDADDAEPDIGYPGVTRLTDFTENMCAMMFESEYVSDTTGLRYRAVVPAEKAWVTERTVVCVLYDREGDRLDRSYVVVE
ncbi:serine/threonine-protein kinase [Actinophytocola sp.]|uniref:serine/threonine-protein kinase n=1 Tax=Actinophytocola sp. TaxID=1872138 RepID=UPI002D549DA0|nr:serine/threonine-protein kinase [Actinophytocola sp.]HYQ65870.1 serine/threonine-protein kinase [Actinophytocola sp.]